MPSPAPHRRSRHELRLEQIAIWGDAAYTTRHTESSFSVPRTLPSLPTPCHKSPLDIHALDETPSLDALGLIPDASHRGSFSMCHSASADIFRRSGRYAPISTRPLNTSSQPKLPRVIVSDVPTDQLLLSKRSSVAYTPRESSWRDSISKGRKRPTERSLFADEPLHLVKPDRETVEMRERDENDFRMSNAKLPQREDKSETGLMRRLRNSTTILGRYSRSTSSQLPHTRHSNRRPARHA